MGGGLIDAVNVVRCILTGCRGEKGNIRLSVNRISLQIVRDRLTFASRDRMG